MSRLPRDPAAEKARDVARGTLIAKNGPGARRRKAVANRGYRRSVAVAMARHGEDAPAIFEAKRRLGMAEARWLRHREEHVNPVARWAAPKIDGLSCHDARVVLAGALPPTLAGRHAVAHALLAARGALRPHAHGDPRAGSTTAFSASTSLRPPSLPGPPSGPRQVAAGHRPRRSASTESP